MYLVQTICKNHPADFKCMWRIGKIKEGQNVTTISQLFGSGKNCSLKPYKETGTEERMIGRSCPGIIVPIDFPCTKILDKELPILIIAIRSISAAYGINIRVYCSQKSSKTLSNCALLERCILIAAKHRRWQSNWCKECSKLDISSRVFIPSCHGFSLRF